MAIKQDPSSSSARGGHSCENHSDNPRHIRMWGPPCGWNVLYENVPVHAHPGLAIFSPNLAASDHPLDGLSPASDIQSLTLSKRSHDASGSGPARAQTAPSLGRGLSSSPYFRPGRSPPPIRYAPACRMVLPAQTRNGRQVSVPLVDTCGRRRPPPASTPSPTPTHPVPGKARIRLAPLLPDQFL